MSRASCALVAVALISAALAAVAQAPNLYITFHGGSDGVNNIYSYDLDGNQLSDSILSGFTDLDGLRTAIILGGSGNLLVCNAHKTESKILQFGTCGADGTRTYVSEFASTNLAHPYGLVSGLDAASGADVVWADNQDTYDIVQFSTSGSFQQQVKQFGTDELRSMAYDPVDNVLYVADETQDAVLGYNTKSNTWDASLSFPNINDPIGLYIDGDSRSIYIGSNSNTSDSYVYQYSLDSRQLLQRFTDSDLQHPAGMVVYEGMLYVISQTVGSLLAFDVASGDLNGTLIDSFPDTPEQILFSPC